MIRWLYGGAFEATFEIGERLSNLYKREVHSWECGRDHARPFSALGIMLL
jgi:hypothetical protein